MWEVKVAVKNRENQFLEPYITHETYTYMSSTAVVSEVMEFLKKPGLESVMIFKKEGQS